MATTKLHSTPLLDPSSTTILVTGASGYIGANIIREALDIGYTVRGTARTQEKADKTVKLFSNHPNYHTVIVPDFKEPSEYIDNAVKDVDVILLVASDTSFDEDPKSVIDGVVDGTLNFLKAAKKEKRVKRFVLTSSSTAALTPVPNKEIFVTKEAWNDEAIDHAWNKRGESLGPNPYGFVVYAASKTAGEQAFWKFVKEEKPHFVANTILPNFNAGRVLGSAGVTGVMAIEAFKKGSRDMLPPQWFIDVVDDARLHLIAGVLDGDLKDERIFAFGEAFNWNDINEAIKKVRPDTKADLKFVDGEARDLSKVPNELGAKLLKKWYGQEGYTSLEESIRANLADV